MFGLQPINLHQVQVSLHRLLKLLNVKGRGGFDLSSAVVPTIDVSRLIEEEYGGPIDESAGDPTQQFASIVGIGGAGFQAACQLWNPTGSGYTVKVESARINTFIAATFNGEIHDGPYAVPDANAALVRGAAAIEFGDCVARFFGNDGTALPTRLKVFYQAALTGGATAANAFEEFVQRPIWLPPGRALTVKTATNVAGTNMIVNFRFREFRRG